MSRISKLFAERIEPVLSIFYTAGYPTFGSTVEIGLALANAGVDLLEIGFPFSDSLVDGPVIQIANEKALKDGMNFATYFEEIRNLRSQSEVAIVVMCCLNPILKFGVEKFADACVESGVDGVLVADLPPEELDKSYREIFTARGLDMILLITGHCPEDRIRYIDSIASGFLYVVSSDAITGSQLEVDENRRNYFSRLRSLQLKNPLVVGFGISDKKTFDAACSHTDGAIIGSAFIKALGAENDLSEVSTNFVNGIRGVSL